MTAPEIFGSESAFENAVIRNMVEKYRWQEILKNPTEVELIRNWARIVFENNNTRDSLDGVPLSQDEVQDLINQITSTLNNPADVQRWLQGKEMFLTRNHPELDESRNGQTIALKIFDPRQVGGGSSTYQIAQQPRFKKKTDVTRNRRGDFLLLIWGLPLVHVELKNSQNDVTEAAFQIQRYSREGAFTGFLSTIQLFVAMTPQQMLYFANPGSADAFNQDFWFEWTDEQNEPYSDWQQIVRTFLGIPPAHRMIGDFMIADGGDDVLKVMRPYQVHAAVRVLKRLEETNAAAGKLWNKKHQLGGYIWHTTGSGKTMTSFTTAMLAARERLAEKVVFVLDRVELGNQSEIEYTNFAGDKVDVHRPGNASMLLADLKNLRKRLIITSIQKLDKLVGKGEAQPSRVNVPAVQNQRIVFIVDEAHRTTFGEMFARLKTDFPNAVVFGFTGTPILEENKRKESSTATLFGDELHRYSIYYGLRDRNVLGFDVVPVQVYDPVKMREMVARQEAGLTTTEPVPATGKQREVYDRFQDEREVPWVSHHEIESGDNGEEREGRWVKGIEDYAPKETWESDEYRDEVVNHVITHWRERSRQGRLHSLFAASSIAEAFLYYRLFKEHSDLKITAIVNDANENSERAMFLDPAFEEVLTDYNQRFKRNFSMENYDAFRKEAADRLAHKGPFRRVSPDKQLDMIIVVNQLLTGYDSKFVNTLYLDRVLQGPNLVQAFSRTNRVYEKHIKPFGLVVYFRKPLTMAQNITDAFDLYAGHDDLNVFADPLPATLRTINTIFATIRTVFEDAGVVGFEKLPSDKAARALFANQFALLTQKVEAALIQGFNWGQTHYDFGEESVGVELDEATYKTLLQRYAELVGQSTDLGGGEDGGIPLDLGAMAIAQRSQKIDFDYLDERFSKWRKAVAGNEAVAVKEDLLQQLQREWAKLGQEDQAIARQIVDDLLDGVIDKEDDTKTFRDYLNLYKTRAKSRHIRSLAQATSLVEDLIKEALDLSDGTRISYRDHGRGKALQDGVDEDRFSDWLESTHGLEVLPWEVADYRDSLLDDFFTQGGFDVDEWTAH